MKLQKTTSLLLALGLGAVLTTSAWADAINARLKSVDTTANTITVTEKKQDITFSVNGDTHFLNVEGGALANGINSGDLKPGARLAITYTKKDDKSVASEVKLRPARKAPATPPTPPVVPPAPPATQ